MPYTSPDPQATGPRLITTEVIDKFKALGPLRDAWDGLLARSFSRSVFLSWDWVETWWKHYGTDFEPLVIVARDDGVPCGIAPLIIRKGDIRRLEFFGQNKAYGEYLDFLVAEGDECRVTPEICRAMVERYDDNSWQSLSLAVILERSPNLAMIRHALERHGLDVVLQHRTSPYIRLPATWAEYLRIKGKKLRKRIEYNERRLARLGKVAVEFPRNLCEVDHFLENLIALHCYRWKVKPNEIFFGFHREIARRFYSLDRLLLARLKVGDRVIAAKYDFVFDKRAWGYQGGWLREYAKYEVGSVLLCELFKHCIDNELAVYDFLEGEDWYKRRWSTHSLASVDLTCGPAGPPFVF